MYNFIVKFMQDRSNPFLRPGNWFHCNYSIHFTSFDFFYSYLSYFKMFIFSINSNFLIYGPFKCCAWDVGPFGPRFLWWWAYQANPLVKSEFLVSFFFSMTFFMFSRVFTKCPGLPSPLPGSNLNTSFWLQ